MPHQRPLLDPPPPPHPKVGLFYPETGERCQPFLEWDSLIDAAAWMKMQPAYVEITAQGDDHFAFLNRRTGDLVVVRSLAYSCPKGSTDEPAT